MERPVQGAEEEGNVACSAQIETERWGGAKTQGAASSILGAP